MYPEDGVAVGQLDLCGVFCGEKSHCISAEMQTSQTSFDHATVCLLPYNSRIVSSWPRGAVPTAKGLILPSASLQFAAQRGFEMEEQVRRDERGICIALLTLFSCTRSTRCTRSSPKCQNDVDNGWNSKEFFWTWYVHINGIIFNRSFADQVGVLSYSGSSKESFRVY